MSIKLPVAFQPNGGNGHATWQVRDAAGFIISGYVPEEVAREIAHALNVLPQVVARLKEMQQAIPTTPKFALIWELKEAVDQALAIAEPTENPTQYDTSSP